VSIVHGEEKVLQPRAPKKRAGVEALGAEDRKAEKRLKAGYEAVRRKNLFRENKEEDKVIKKLEKLLYLNKRKRKKTLPKSFTYDGLDCEFGQRPMKCNLSGLRNERNVI
jgi:hypothetical protein